MLTIVTGGIGSGKSVVSRLLRIMGYQVYDCDLRARQLMLTDPQLISELRTAFGPDTYRADGQLNKPFLASTIFNNPDQLQLMNSLVHPAVARDIQRTLSTLNYRNASSPKSPNTSSSVHLFVETAIYFESHFDRLIHADRVWCVVAPDELRISRTMLRDNASRPQVLSRIGSQMPQSEKIRLSDSVIWNDEVHSVIDQVNRLIIL